jgi:hypothetical protein
MNTEQIIDLLIEDDLNDWNDSQSKDAYFATILRKGFIGYEQSYHDELLMDAIDRGLIEEVKA